MPVELELVGFTGLLEVVVLLETSFQVGSQVVLELVGFTGLLEVVVVVLETSFHVGSQLVVVVVDAGASPQ